MRKIEFSKFKLVEADATHATSLVFSVMANNTIRIGSRLMKKLNAEFVNFYVVDDGTVVAIKGVTTDAHEACRVKKNGEVRSLNLCESLRRVGITLPARYNVEWCESNTFWQGEIDKEYSFRKSQKTVLKKKKIKAKRIRLEYIQTYSGLISSVAKKYRLGIERDDLEALAHEGFLRACQTWNPAYCNFDSYARYAINDCLSAAKKQYAGNFGASLDAPLNCKVVCLASTIRAASVPIEDALYLRILFDSLELSMRGFVQCCMLGYSEDEIQSMLVLSFDELEALKKEIREKWKEYDPERFM